MREPVDLTAAARRIHDDLPVFDGHNDLPWALRTRAAGDLDATDPSGPIEGFHTDVPRLLAGGVGAQFWSVFVPAWTRSPLAVTLEQCDLVDQMVSRDSDHLVAADSAADVEAAGDGKIACLKGAEGGHCIENSLEGLHRLRERGVRYLTLTHGDTIDWADSATDASRSGGLSAFGEAVVGEMNRLGMIVDISHVAVETMRDALRVTERPLMASHSSAFALAPHPRNVPDEIVELVAENDGVVMVCFYPGFLVPETAENALEIFAKARSLRRQFGWDQEAEFEDAMTDLMGTRRWNRGSVADVADHIEHLSAIGGVDHVGIGSDFDGINLTPVGLEDVSCFPNITAELLSRGWPEPDIRKILGENVLRVLAANS